MFDKQKLVLVLLLYLLGMNYKNPQMPFDILITSTIEEEALHECGKKLLTYFRIDASLIRKR
jgi:hypothetical protein